ncbi:thiopeptide-type bacteriocin biosynthesis protein [Amycolatopsis bartoniae]|uniref:Lantibiotic dehydratase n=1 Tax=Amycolatopsis bartoniae TaxID=941986 RepID=A0A8H9IUK8_9PSEU|nr:lantibiotic dehydratase [Amycolatopsis bartoniae]MBB2939484.1 thiopeptide-type bacteriocin biosynthesis protein [Amycolatopsis bartoniae]GHF66549.1 lantibiotic dehydratase [Amycolatopsis bartoniae]
MPLLTDPSSVTPLRRRAAVPGGRHHVASAVVARLSLIDPGLADRLLAACDRDDRQAVAVVLDDPLVREAIEVASPALSAEVDRFLGGTASPAKAKRFLDALHRYGLRCRYRPTPLGVFAGVGVVGAGGEPRTAGLGVIRRVIRPSASWCAALCGELAAEDDALLDLCVAASRSVYSRQRELIVLRRDENSGSGLAVTRHVPLMRSVLAQCGSFRPAREVVALVAAEAGCAPESAARFVLDMIRHGVLVTELAEVETAPAPWQVLRDTVRDLAARGDATWAGWRTVAGELSEVEDLLARTPADRPVEPHRYRELRAALAKLHGPPDLHVDAVLAAPVPDRLPAENAVLTACSALAAINPVATSMVLGAVTRWYTDRYSDSHTVRLAELFLPGSGFDVTAATSPGKPRTAEDPPAWTRTVETLGLLERGPEVDVLPLLSKAELKEASAQLPPAFVAFVRSAPVRDSPQPFHLRNFSAGLQLIGRFGSLSDDLLEVLRRFVAAEESGEGDLVRVEIRCPCLGRSHNIAQRPPLRQVVVDFGPPARGSDVFGRPLVSLPVDDLVIRVADGEIRVFSERLGRRVLPSVASAVVPHRCTYPMATFLTLLSGQATQPRHWSWRSWSRLPVLPRITAGDVVLAPRQWSLGPETVDALEARCRCGTGASELPRFLAAGAGENQLLVDTASARGLQILRRELGKGESRVVVQEPWPQPDGWQTSAPDLRAAELVLPFHRPSAPAAPRKHRAVRSVRGRVPHGPLPRYGPGSPWASVKLYGRPERLDDLLAAAAPLIGSAREAGVVRRWFFVRYADPDHHLRLRFRGRPRELWGEFLPELWRTLDELDRYWDRSVVDEYRPESDRYGGPRGLVLAEHVFAADSDLAVGLNRVGEMSRLGTAVAAMDRLLEGAGFPLEERRRLVSGLEKARAARHGADSAPVEAGRFDRARLVPAADPAVDEWARRITPVTERLRTLLAPEVLSAVVSSLLHMHANRLFVHKPTFWEVVTYSTLRRAHDRTLRTTRQPVREESR